MITGQNPLSTDEETSLTIRVADLIIDDPDGPGALLDVRNGENYSVSGNTITPAEDFDGKLAIARGFFDEHGVNDFIVAAVGEVLKDSTESDRGADAEALFNDILAKTEDAEKRKDLELTRADYYAQAGRTDDFAQAVNIGCAGLWHAEGAWPNYAEAAAIGRISSSQIIATGSSEYGWDEDRSGSGGFFNQP